MFVLRAGERTRRFPMNFGDFHAEAFVENFPSIFHAPQFPRESLSQRRREYVKRESCLLKAQKLFMMDNFITQSKLYLLFTRPLLANAHKRSPKQHK